VLAKVQNTRILATHKPETTMTNTDRHIRHNGKFIDASFRKDGTIEYYVVQGSHGRFYTLEAAKEIAAYRGSK
jgi:hypothetical protein